MRGLFKLLLQYVFASESLFFILIMPLILFGIMGEALIFAATSSIADSVTRHLAEQKIAASFVSGISGTTVISSALFLIPITIVDFKNSVLMKRIGATNVKPWQFLLLVILLFFLQSSVSFFYSRFIATILYGDRLGWTVGFNSKIAMGYVFTLLIMVVAIFIGMVIAAISATVRQVTTTSNIIYFPIAIMSGGLVPLQLVYSSTFLKGFSWANPFKYVVEPYLRQQGVIGGPDFPYSLPSWADIGYPFIVLGIVVACSFVISRKLKWTT